MIGSGALWLLPKATCRPSDFGRARLRAYHFAHRMPGTRLTTRSRSQRSPPVGRTVRAISRVIKINPKSVVFEVEAWEGDRKIGDGTHRRGIVNALEFGKRFGSKAAHNEFGLNQSELVTGPVSDK